MLNFLSCVLLYLWVAGITALPAPGVDVAQYGQLMSKRSFNDGVQLRVLPLGASIVYGLTSPDGNGFRYGLRNQLVYNGNPVNMIGSVQAGTMADNDCEGWPGYTITQVAAKAELSIPDQPNVVVLHVGTNDCVQSIDIENAGARLGALIDRLFSAIPGVTIIASTLLPNGNANTQANVVQYNSQIPGVVKARQLAGQKITYVDFSSSYFSLADIGSDGTHPTEAGYLKMAEVWYQGIEVANSQGWLTAPAAVAGLSDTVSDTNGTTTCDKVPGAAIGPTQTQMGSGSDDGAYVHVGVYAGGFAGFDNNTDPEGVFWADIDGDGIDDYVYVGNNSDYGLGVALSQTGGTFGDYLSFAFSPSCNRPGVHFVDMTGDGRDDFCCVGPDGGVVCWQNTAGSDPRSPSWVSMGTVKASEGYPQAQVRLADIDGDGRCDYVVFDDSTTNIYGWRNGAVDDGPPAYWYAMRGVISDLPLQALSGWQFVDLNGDKKDDLVWISPDGQVTTWINRRGSSVGLGPAWVSHGVTHAGSSSPVNVTFGASLGSGRADYALTSIQNGTVYVERWQNEDYGGTMVRGDGDRYCDMTGSGSDDYIFINSTGAITLFENDHNWGYWVPWGVIYNANRTRQEIHLADFDADGKCDILLVDKDTGATTVILNEYSSGAFSFSNIGVVTGSATCTEGYGSDKHDLGVRWNDLDGDNRADFLCMQSDGVITGYLNKGVDDMVDQGLIKHAEGKERKNLRLADINGDGRDDFLYVDMITGAVTAWYNGGQIESSGSAFQWNWQGVVSTGGYTRGACVEFGALYGQGRADYIAVEPASNKAWTWFNVCPDAGVGPTDPDLPTGAPSPPQPAQATTGSTTTTGATIAARTPAAASASATATSQTPTSAQALAYPTDTNFNTAGAYCFTSSDGNYVQYSLDAARLVVSSWCERHAILDPTLETALVEAYNAGNGVTVYVSARWAPDQTGCSTKQSFYFNDNSGACYDTFNTDFYCADSATNVQTSFGGGYVFNSPDSGCIEFLQFATQESITDVAAALDLTVASANTVVPFTTTVALSATTATPSGQFGSDSATLTAIGGANFNSSAVG